MAILLSGANRSITNRWADLLKDHFKSVQVVSVEELKSACASRQFEAILLHRMLIDIPGFAALIKSAPTARFFLLSDRPDEEEALVFLKLGIVGYGNTYISSARLIEAMRIVTNGGVWLGQKVIQRLITDTSAKVKEDDKKDNAALILAKLTRAERHIADLIARGQSNLEIAADLKITERTVKAHLTSIYEKTKTGNRLNLALLINLGRNPQG